MQLEHYLMLFGGIAAVLGLIFHIWNAFHSLKGESSMTAIVARAAISMILWCGGALSFVVGLIIVVATYIKHHA